MTFSFAWVDEGDAFTSRNDEDVFAFDLSQFEGEFATLTVELRNPRVGLLATGRKRWCWFGHDGTALFKGRLTALPTDIREEVVTLNFVARPSDFAARKRTVADTMRVFPYYDPLWVSEEARGDPDIVLEARPELWHTDRVMHEVTSSDLIAGEDGTIDLGGDVFHDGVSIAFKGAPLRKVRVEATCQWTQLASGTVDISKRIRKLFPSDRVQSLTSKGLLDDWPEKDDRIGSGWSFGPSSCRGNENPLFMQSVLTSTRSGRWIRFFIIELLQSTTLAYDASRTLVEKISFEVTCDTQEIMSAQDDDEAVIITLQTEDVDKPIDPGSVTPIRDPRRRSFFPTDRGQQSISYLVALARAVWERMVDANEHEIRLTHDGYLKLYQMDRPVLRGFDLIAVDEAQDLNPCTFDIVCRQTVPVVMVGDAAQAIYSFRGSTNALTLFEADERLPLTRSFRFGRGIAQLANALLGHFRHGFDQPLVGAGAPQRTRFTVDTGKAFAVIARTNAVVFEEAVAFLDLNRRFHFVGGTEGYKLEKALDAYRLWVGERGLMRDPYLRSFGSFDELVGLAEASEEPELRQLVRVVCDYGHQIPRLIEDIRSRHTDVPKHAWADFDGIYFCTAHKAKGLEFEQVWLADDFMRFFENGCELRPDQVDQEEVNILYVALTRARAAIRLSESFDEWVPHRRLPPPCDLPSEGAHPGTSGL